MFAYMSFSINNMLLRLHIYSTLYNKESHNNLDTTDIICNYKYKCMYIVRK